MSRVLFWFRRDLRLHDNVGLHAAREEATELYCVFVVDPDHIHWPHRCADRLQYKLECVASLREDIREHGGDLILRRWDQVEVLTELADQLSIQSVYWNRAYEPYERERDERVTRALKKMNVSIETFKDQVLFEKKQILTNETEPYQVFSPYARKWKQRSKPEPVEPVSRFSRPTEVEPGDVPGLEELEAERRLEFFSWETAEVEARKKMETFLSGGLATYHENRDYPARQGTSRLSPYLRFGLISPRELYARCREEQRNVEDPEGVETFVEELIWRDFYHQVLFNYPRVATENFKQKYDDLEWEDHPDWVEAWKQGETGFPLVDAAMRQLNNLGWMHNRLRMIVAMFLTKHCLTHWKVGEKYFMNRLLDGDQAANNGGWQWSASTGTDAVAYTRIFNPVTQSEKYDPEGVFIRRYCPELSELPDRAIHAPWEADKDVLTEAGVRLGENYPEPILDHKVRREHALNVFREVS